MSGRLGGLASLWDLAIFSVNSVVKNRNFLLTKGQVKGLDEQLCNVYAPQGTANKKELWTQILSLKESYVGMWFLLGDFNSVRCPEERRNSGFNSVAARDFNSFIFDAALAEFDMKGGKFTFSVGHKFSKIDSFLVCSDFFNKWLEACCKTFRFFNSCLERKGVDDVVRNAYNRGLVGFKCIRGDLRKWWEETKFKEEEEVNIMKKELNMLDKEMENRDLLEEETWIRMECITSISEVEHRKSMDLRQRSRIRWASLGDENSAYFHGIINAKKAVNNIPGMAIDGIWCDKPKKMKKEIFGFFRNKFREEYQSRPTFSSPGVKRLDQIEADLLICPFSKEEVKAAVFGRGSDREPGPDGFNFHLIKHYWSLLEDDFLQYFIKVP
ncbi:uncharacterized protein LOC143543237 [Bidens hawaiensis]|uniref:uncharacterized protein LOC143543237 n=1 Tax=Bidens hawaiensis TaxID=980011 RepID=UPI0040490B0C